MRKIISAKKLKDVSNVYGDTFYILDSDVFEANYRSLLGTYKEYYKKTNIAYSFKTNYIPKLVKIVNDMGGYAEVVSDMEAEIAIKSGFDLSHIIWNGPVKNYSFAEKILLKGGVVNIDSISEMETIKKIAREHINNNINVGVRCNYDVGDGVISRFGVDITSADFKEIMQNISEVPNIDLKGLHAHFALRNPKFWVKRTEGMLAIYDLVVSEYQLCPEYLDLGGGIYGEMTPELANQLGVDQFSYKDYAENSAKIFAEHFEGKENSPLLYIEPGTALAANCMRFVTRIETIKEVRGKTFITTMGSQKNISMNGINPPIEVVPSGNVQVAVNNADIVGYTCIEGDILQKDYCGSVAIGDYIVISNCGSYSIVMKPPFILPNFSVIDISGDDIELIKRKETFEDLFCTYTF